VRGLAAIRKPGPGGLVVVHFNHGLRGEQSDAEERFAVELAHQLSLPYETGRWHGQQLAEPVVEDRVKRPGAASHPHDGSCQPWLPEPDSQTPKLAASATSNRFDWPADSGGDGLEAAARAARYQFLRSEAERLGARYVATAHTADDQAETILHRIVRGTGLAGLAGIPRARPLGPAASLIRPLLGVRREELLAYLAALGQPFCQDPTNEDPRHTRNRTRHQVLPELAQQYNPNVRQALVRLGRLAGEAQELIDGLVGPLVERSVVFRPNEVHVSCEALAAQPRYLVRETLLAAWRQQGWPEQQMGFGQWELMVSMVAPVGPGMPASTHVFPGQVTARREGDSVVLRVAPLRTRMTLG
jgi:tRNA(Ile)-lysidine synthase